MVEMLNRSHWYCLLVAIVGAIFVAVTVYYIAWHHVWPLSRDQWHMYAPYFERGLWKTMLTPMSTHRHVFPYLFFHADMTYFHGLNHFLVACGALFNGLIIVFLIRALRQETRFAISTRWVLGLFLITQLTWLINIAQLGWGFMSTQYYLAILTLILAVQLLYEYERSGSAKNYLLAGLLVCGFISTFSFGMGILVWPILFIFARTWQMPLKTYQVIIGGMMVCLVLFFVLPGGEEISHSILLSPVNILVFTFQLAAGPVYYLLKSWRFCDPEQLKDFASFIGVLGSAYGIYRIWDLFKVPRRLSIFETLCYTLMLIGIGTAALVSVTRYEMFLDVWVDRYQIWAVLFWAGLLPLTFIRYGGNKWLARVLLCLMAVFPVAAFPSQLDLGSRLYEYKARVQEALLFYQVEVADRQAAMDALHWDWKSKLDNLFYVMNEIKNRNKNVFYNSPARYLGKSIQALTLEYEWESVSLQQKKIRQIGPSDLLPNTPFTVRKAYSFYSDVPEDRDWDYAVRVDEEKIIRGIGTRVKHSQLPRPVKNFSIRKYNLFAVSQGTYNPDDRWLLVKLRSVPAD
jgi:hypothetical protein